MKKDLQLKTQNNFISLKVDWAFKHVMKNKKALRGFLGAVLGINPEEITDIEFKDPCLDKEVSDQKQGILDVRATILNGRFVDIELQINYFKYWKNRTMFYNFKMYVE